MSTNKLDSEKATDNKGIISVALSKITVSSFNPRKAFEENELKELSDSIRQVGVLQPVLVRPKGKKFEIVCGERRFKACVQAELKTIPAIVRSLTDDEALEIAITENLQRKDISPIEEAIAYKRLADTGRYDVANLSVRFGKSEAYIRNRMKLNDLTENILKLVNDDVLSISVALELCKYSAEAQTDIYKKHLSDNQNYSYENWCKLTSKEFIRRLENNYCSDLSRYHFDKSACEVCHFNTNAYTLFTEKEGKCTNVICLREKNKLFLVETCKKAMQENPDIEIVLPAYRRGNNDDVFAELEEQGYTLNEYNVISFPKPPEMPEREQFEEEDYDEAIEEYYEDCTYFEEDKEKVETLISEGKAKVMLTVDNNELVKCYAIIPQIETQASANTNESDIIQKLEKQDRRYKEIAVENIVDDTKKYIRETEIPQSDFTELEESMLYFIMLEELKRKHLTLFLDNPKDKWHLTDKEKVIIISNLTEEQKTVIRRDFLVKHLSNTYGNCSKSVLMLEFARLHFPETLTETENKYNGIYQKRHMRINEKKEALNKVNEVQEVA